MRKTFARFLELSLPPLLVVVAVLALAGCGGAQASSMTPSPEGQRAIATSMAARAATSAAAAPEARATATPQTIASIMAGAPTSPLLDGMHLAAGVGCEACHGTLPANGSPNLPSTDKCLSCHGGSYEALVAKTSSLGSMNPHKAHIGKLDCDQCHGVHKPFEYECNDCHNFAIPEKYRSQTQG